MNKKIVLRTSFRTTLLRKLRCTNEKQSRKILIKRNGVRRNNTYENDNPSTKVITGKTAKALNELDCCKVYSDSSFSVLCRARHGYKLQLSVLEAVCQRIHKPNLCVQKDSIIRLKLF